MAAAIDLPNAADTVLLGIGNDDPIPLLGEAGVTYRLVGKRSHVFLPRYMQSLRSKRNDFHFNRKMIDVANRPQLTLKADPTTCLHKR